METQVNYDQGDLSAFERRLAEWQPKTEGLDPDAMLFAAGLAAGQRRARFLWPALCALLLVPIGGLGVWGFSERSERLALTSQLGRRAPFTDVLASNGAVSKFRYTPAANDYFQQRKRVEQDASYYLASIEPARLDAHGLQLPQTEIMRAGQWSDLLE
jgi:hypothetical protein